MHEKRPKRGKILVGFLVLAFLGLGVWAHTASADHNIISLYPADESYDIPINANIQVQFAASMDTGTVGIEFDDEYGNEIDGSYHWSTTTNPDDTLLFIP